MNRTFCFLFRFANNILRTKLRNSANSSLYSVVNGLSRNKGFQRTVSKLKRDMKVNGLNLGVSINVCEM